MPNRHSAFYENISPEIIIEGLDGCTVTLAVTLDDMGHPITPGFNHWIAWNIPAVQRIPENIPKSTMVEMPLHVEQGIAYGKHCYKGPKPPFNWKHEYLITVYALDAKLSISPDSDKAAVLKAMEGHMLQKGVLTATYQRRRQSEV